MSRRVLLAVAALLLACADPLRGEGTWATLDAPVRAGATLSTLRTGEVLLAGGYDPICDPTYEIGNPGSGAAGSPPPPGLAYVVDPVAGASLAVPMPGPRSGHSATVLADGRVLVAGGDANPWGGLASAVVFEPATLSWSATGSMSTGRRWHTATLLTSGEVLVIGGDPDPMTSSDMGTAELYDPATGTWSPAGVLAVPRPSHAAALLADGRVLVTGGDADVGSGYRLPSATVEVWDPVTRTFSAGPSMPSPHARHTATVLTDGRVLVAGGSWPIIGGDPAPGEPIPPARGTREAALYEPAMGRWSDTGPLLAARGGHAATALQDGRVLAVGGALNPAVRSLFPVVADAEIWDPLTGRWSAAGPAARRAPAGAALLPDGRVLAAADGACDGGLAAQVYTPDRGRSGP